MVNYWQGEGNQNSDEGIINRSLDMAPVTYNEEKNILICGPPKSGRTSLGFTLCRGLFPSCPGGRFEGWSLGACATPSTSPLSQSNSASFHNPNEGKSKLKYRPRGASVRDTNHSSHGHGFKIKPYFVNFTFWEDRPRREDDTAPLMEVKADPVEEDDTSEKDADEEPDNDQSKNKNRPVLCIRRKVKS